MNLVILTEEESMKVALEHLLIRMGIPLDSVTIIPHQGKSDLEKSVPRKLRAWKDPTARFLILRDNDRGDCKARKSTLIEMIKMANKEEVCKVRIVCQELEAWFLADHAALRLAGYLAEGSNPGFLKKDPDAISHPVHVMQKLRPGYGKVTGAREIAPHLDPANVRSASFRHTVLAIKALIAA